MFCFLILVRFINNNLPLVFSWTVVPPTPPTFIPGNCPPKWIGFGDNCYMFEAELQYVSWWEASYFCEKTFDNSHILNIHSRGENAFVKRVAAEKYGYYGVWLGLTRNTTGKLTSCGGN